VKENTTKRRVLGKKLTKSGDNSSLRQMYVREHQSNALEGQQRRDQKKTEKELERICPKWEKTKRNTKKGGDLGRTGTLESSEGMERNPALGQKEKGEVANKMGREAVEKRTPVSKQCAIS